MSESVPSYRNGGLPVAARVSDLLARMTLAEKVGQMLQLDARAGVEPLIREMHVGSVVHASPQGVRDAIRLSAETRLGIPVLVADDCIHGHSFWGGATIFPTQLGMAATWDAGLIERVARVTAVEVAATGIHWTFSPVLCIARDLRWGRVGETFGEDPHLVGELASAMVRGYQGAGLTDPTAILATAKHFAGYSETQGGRDASEADISQRKLRSWFLPPFERVAREGCRTFMLGYQSMDGVPVTVNDWLLTDVLRGEWGYTGTLVTDWDNVGRMVWEQRIFSTCAEASAAAVRAGNDVVMTTPSFFEGALQAVREGLLDEALIDQAVARVLTLKFELGLFDGARVPEPERQATVIGSADHAELNLEVARRSLVLLRNDGVLPLPSSTSAADDGRAVAPPGTRAKTILVVGPNADDAQNQLGDWAGSSGQIDWLPDGHPRELIETVVDGLRACAPTGWTVTVAQGARMFTLDDDPRGAFFPDGQPRPPVVVPYRPDPALIEEAVAAASTADYVVAVVGDRIELAGESKSTATLELIGDQVAMLDALAATGTPLVVILLASKPVALPPSALAASALVWAANPGMRGGRAIAEVLLGLVEPSGRLPVSFPVHVGQQPTYYNQIRGQHGDRYADLTQRPAFAFGDGLSYTSVEYSNLRLAAGTVREADVLTADVTLTNTGSRPVLETVQVYVRDVVTSATWADKELKAFRQIMLAPAQRVVVPLELPVSSCTIVDRHGRRVVEPGEFDLLVGPSSRDELLLAARFTVEPVARPVTTSGPAGKASRPGLASSFGAATEPADERRAMSGSFAGRAAQTARTSASRETA